MLTKGRVELKECVAIKCCVHIFYLSSLFSATRLFNQLTYGIKNVEVSGKRIQERRN